jgi:hypothetical protein
MSPRGVWILAAAVCAFPPAVAAQAPGPDKIEVIGTSAGLPPPPPPQCLGPDCATVVAVNALGRRAVPVQGIDGSGVYLASIPSVAESDLADSGLMEGSPLFSPGDQALAPLQGEAGMVRYENLWRVVVRFDSGVLQGVQQNYPPLLNVGDRVRVDGRRIRLAE